MTTVRRWQPAAALALAALGFTLILAEMATADLTRWTDHHADLAAMAVLLALYATGTCLGPTRFT